MERISWEIVVFDGKVLCNTGGSGSFGNAVLQRFLDTEIAEIRIFSRNEKKQDDMRKRYADAKLKFYIGHVRDYQSVLNATRGVDYIFQAAAHPDIEKIRQISIGDIVIVRGIG